MLLCARFTRLYMVHLAAGGAREPELMQHVFTCLSSICKRLQKPLAADIPSVRIARRTGTEDAPCLCS